MIKVAVFASGNGSNFESLVVNSSEYKVELLIVDKKNAYAIKRAEKLKVPYYFVNPKDFSSKEAFEAKILEYLDEYQIEIIALAGYMRFIGDVLLNKYQMKIVNIHPSYLPDLPGTNSIQKAYESNLEYTGVTIHYTDKNIDTGPIIYQEKVKIDRNKRLEEFEDEIHKIEHGIFPKVLNEICRRIK